MINSQITQAFHSAGLRLTKPRQRIIEFMADNFEHPTARQIYARLAKESPTLSLATVYNTLDVLVEHGVVHDLGTAFDDEVHYDGQVTPHINLVCSECHTISDHPLESAQDLSEQIYGETGFKVSGSRIVYYGRCRTCLSKK